jgi:hypothetical protein
VGGNHQLGSFFVCSYALPKASENGAEKGTTPDLPLGRSIGGVVVGLAFSDSVLSQILLSGTESLKALFIKEVRLGNEYYDPDVHGPFDEVGVSDRNCMLEGGYILCPGLDDKLECTLFHIKPVTEKVTISGLMGERRPVRVPVRCTECREADPTILLKIAVPLPAPPDDDEDGASSVGSPDTPAAAP